MNNLKLDFISDVVCPWCVIGYGHLQQAIKELGVEDKVSIEWHPFELNPNMPAEGENLSAHSARKYGSTPESSAQFRKEMTEKGKAVGFNFNYFPEMKMVNTRASHVALDLALKEGKQTELKQRLFQAFFSEHKDISDRKLLIEEAKSVGINTSQLTELLDDPMSFSDIKQQEERWLKLGINSVPTVVFNQKHAVSGAHPVETFKQLIATELNL